MTFWLPLIDILVSLLSVNDEINEMRGLKWLIMITVIIQVLKWDARSQMIDHDNCFHAGVEMRCEI